MVKVVKKRRIFDDEADWLPPKGRAFKMKTGGKEKEQEADQKAKPQAAPKAAPQKLYTDSDGLDMAYADQSNMFLDSQGTLYVSGTKGGFLGQEWLENYKTMGVPLIQKMLGLPSDYRIEENERYKQLDDFVKANPGKVKNMVGHSKGSAVIDVWMKNHPEFTGQSRLYATPYEDVLGKEKYKDNLNTFNLLRNAEYEGSRWKNPAEKWLEDKAVEKLTSFFGLDGVKGMRERNELRLTTPTDPATILDSSADVENDPNWWRNAAKGFGHDYHTIASKRQGFEGDGSGLNHGPVIPGPAPIDNTVKATWETQPFNPFNQNLTEGENKT